MYGQVHFASVLNVGKSETFLKTTVPLFHTHCLNIYQACESNGYLVLLKFRHEICSKLRFSNLHGFCTKMNLYYMEKQCWMLNVRDEM